MTDKTASENQIRGLIEKHAEALRAKNAKAAVSNYAADVVTFDLAPPLQSVGVGAAAEQELDRWFATWRGPLGYDVRDFSVTTGKDMAFCHGFVRISGTKVDGERPDVWARQTLGLRKIEGAWKIVHEHTSVPFYMDGSYRAAIDLKP